MMHELPPILQGTAEQQLQQLREYLLRMAMQGNNSGGSQIVVKGEKGDRGERGPKGDKGDKGDAGDPVSADRIIEFGSSGGWDWEKWESGKYVCRGTFTQTLTNYSSLGSILYGYVSTAIAYPIKFAEIPTVLTNSTIGSGFALSMGDYKRSASSFTAYALSTSSGSQSCRFTVEAVGRWK